MLPFLFARTSVSASFVVVLRVLCSAGREEVSVISSGSTDEDIGFVMAAATASSVAATGRVTYW